MRWFERVCQSLQEPEDFLILSLEAPAILRSDCPEITIGFR